MAYTPLRKLGPQHEAFCLNFVARPHNARQALIDAGFAAGGAKQRASRMLHDPVVMARVKQLIEEKHKALHMDVDEILARAAMLARGDLRFLYDENGLFKPPHELDEMHAVQISGLDIVETFTGTGKKRQKTGQIVKLRLRDPLGALRLLAEHKKLVKGDDAGVNALASALADRLKAARERRRTKEQPK